MSQSYLTQRQFAYRQQGLYIEEIQELTMEYTLAIAAGETAVADEIALQLADIYAQRELIKQQYPKEQVA